MSSKLIFSIFIMGFVLLGSGCNHNTIGQQQNKKDDIIIASANPMTGNSKEFGSMKVKAIQLAVEEVNAAGGIQGRKIKLLVGDDASSPKEAHKLAEKIAADQSVVAVLGHWNSASTMAARNVYNGAGIPVITDSVNKTITDGTTPYVFRVIPTDKVEAEQLGEYSFYQLGLKRMAIIYTNNDYSKGMKDYFRERLQRIGGEITAIEIFSEGRTTDFTSELYKIKYSKPDGLFIAGYSSETASIIRQARAIGLELPIIGTDGISSEEFILLGKEAVEGVRFNGFFYNGIQENGSEEFRKRFQNRYHKEPDSYAALAYDSALLLIEAMKKNGISREGIYDYLSKVENYPGVTGHITFDQHHDVKSKITILTIRNGKIIKDDIQL
ncbi:ABC transporter substrate-binding protein [Pelosinus propionicus]|uniref:Amino acid/amide ABC transporter substrate-binding protein, HAAT family n=1 Tax=Pelosinus propionicus DSM 13327 TaxID=1123291 RepID=A0A1I4L580_9FIRM|nr:ABC transporter substrate-binding protein [Pelosinus propionicus]SFL86026.1 amino acid/amide ABC transporter substrate-binding protein, HAAT family [Pelosinus propionicus DSM 13327]